MKTAHLHSWICPTFCLHVSLSGHPFYLSIFLFAHLSAHWIHSICPSILCPSLYLPIHYICPLLCLYLNQLIHSICPPVCLSLYLPIYSICPSFCLELPIESNKVIFGFEFTLFIVGVGWRGLSF